MVRKIFLAFVSVLLLASISFAYNANYRVYDSPTKKGDLLIYPIYVAQSGSETNIQVINTSDTYGVVAKLVVRSQKYSKELRDFLIYLTPNDEFNAKLYMNSDGRAHIVTKDDSRCMKYTENGVSVFTCADNSTDGWDIDLIDADCDDTFEIGYIEVVESWAVDLHLEKQWNGSVPKKTLYDAYWNNKIVNGVGQDVDDNETINSLTGSAEILIANYRLGYPATALAGVDNHQALTTQVETNVLEAGLNSPEEFEAALAKKGFNYPYYQNNGDVSIAIINFPTKLTVYDEDVCEVTGVQGPAFKQFANNDKAYEPEYVIGMYDLNERTTSHDNCSDYDYSPCEDNESLTSFPFEVNILPITAGLTTDMGWDRLTFVNNQHLPVTNGNAYNQTDNITYTGIPAISLLLQYHKGFPYFIEPSYDIVKPKYNGNEVWPFAPGDNVSVDGLDHY